MALLQNPIQRRISSLLGADVSFEHLRVSLLGGSIDARGMRVVTRDDQSVPLLTVDRLRAELSLSKALRGEIVIKSITIERPIVSLIRQPDGSFNLPKRLAPEPPGEDDDANSAVKPDTHTQNSADTSSRIAVEVEKVLLVGGQVRYRQADYEAVVDGILMDVSRANNGFDLTLICESVGRTDQPASLGQLKGTGRLDGNDDLMTIANSSLQLNIDIGDHLHARVSCGSLAAGAGEATVDGQIDLSILIGLLPAGTVPTSVAGLTGHASIKGNGAFDRSSGLRVPSFSIGLSQITVPPVAAQG
ncbi:MAG TPA: hypothetical protein VGN72_15430 [Tepidisphaeraceae bacterium]|jgi:uncharacterized protein involved in outer membrane biogenesis|nr:hypothetical protein [Tepidisphaeraceae bacterium]